jgi:hypothetical protein
MKVNLLCNTLNYGALTLLLQIFWVFFGICEQQRGYSFEKARLSSPKFKQDPNDAISEMNERGPAFLRAGLLKLGVFQ